MSAPEDELSEEHMIIYDRQIRVWGFEAQKKISEALIYMINVDALNFEIGKNLILSGSSLILQDSALITQEDVDSNLFITKADIGVSRSSVCQKIFCEINTLVKIVVSASIDPCAAICFSGTIQKALEVNSICQTLHIPGYYSFVSGSSIFVLTDLIKKNDVPCRSLEQTLNSIPMFLKKPVRRPHAKFYSFLAAIYCQKENCKFEDLLPCIIDEGLLRKECFEITQNLGATWAPSIAVVAGIISQDLVRLITKSGDTFEALLFDGEASIACVGNISVEL